MPSDENGLPEVLDDEECRRLLDSTTVGRLGFTDGALPIIVPVPFTVHDGQVVIPARRSSPMVAGVRGAVVAFEVDSYDPSTRSGWSVTVIGPSHVVGDPDHVGVFDAGDSSPRCTQDDRCYIVVKVGLLRGWRVISHPPQTSPGDVDTVGGSAAR